MDARPETGPGQRIRLSDIAARLGLSHTTVSRALHNSPRVSKALTATIQSLAQEMGYRPDPMLSALVAYRGSRRAKPLQASLAWINCWTDRRRLRQFKEFQAYWQGALECANRFGYRLEEFVHNAEMPMERVNKILAARNIQGLLIPPHGALKVEWQKLDFQRLSAIRFGHTVAELPLHTVGCDQADAGALAFYEMQQRGYRRIAFCGAHSRLRSFGAGFSWAQMRMPKAHQMPPFFFQDERDAALQQPAFEKWLATCKPDAIFTDAERIRSMVEKAGRKIPGDIALASTSVRDCSIDAGIDQHPEEIGRVAVLAVISFIQDGAVGFPKLLREIMVRGSFVGGSTLPDRL